MKGRP